MQNICEGVIKIKTITKSIYVLLAFLAILTPLSVSGESAKCHNWFFKSSGDGSVPIVFGGNTFPDRYGALYLGDTKSKTIYLTFDAGYENGNVEKVVDTLKKHEATGAFFVLPALIRTNTGLIKKMTDNGNLVCNHSYSHKNISNYTTKEALIKELTDLEAVYSEHTGDRMPHFFRPPEGSFSEQSLRWMMEEGYVSVFWSYAYADWDNNSQMSPQKALDKLKANTHNGMVLLLHPTSATNAQILDEYLTYLENEGYRFGSLYELQEYCASKP